MPKMFSVKGFAAGNNAMPSFGSAGAAITANSIAATVAAPKPAESSVELQTSAIEKRWKDDSINATGNEPIAGVGLNFPLWIKVPWSL
jgi:predicted flavoprotein YhiN